MQDPSGVKAENGRLGCSYLEQLSGCAEQSSRQKEWAEGHLAEARAMMDLPALAHGDAVLMQHTKLQNTFTCQPQQRNMHGRVFGGFLMRSHSSWTAVLAFIETSSDSSPDMGLAMSRTSADHPTHMSSQTLGIHTGAWHLRVITVVMGMRTKAHRCANIEHAGNALQESI